MTGTGRIRFGIFDFDPASGELRREGVPVRLQSQPAQVLGLLLQDAGDVVSRDALRLAVWGTDTFVDFDRGLNFCIAQIRAALGDSAESPRFVRTVPKRGYQFIAPVSNGFQAAQTPAAAVPVEAGRRQSHWLRIAVVVVGAAVVSTLAWWAWPVAPVAAPIRVAVARFDNETGNPALDRFADGLTDALVVELAGAGSGRFEVIGNAAILRQPRAKRDLIGVASVLRAGYVVLGQVQGESREGAAVRVLAHLIALPDQTHVQVVRRELEPGQPLKAEQEIAREVTEAFLRPLTEGRRRPVRR